MATTPTSQNAADIAALSQTVHTMNGTLGMLVKVVWVAIAFGAAAAGGLAYQASDMKQQVGKIQGNIESGTLADTLKEILNRLPAEKPPQQQGLLEPTPRGIEGWTGVKAETKDELAKALIAAPPTKDPVWVYTNDPAAAQALEGMLTK